MSYVGIDYGMGISNRDPENPEIHYGVISQHTPSQWIWDDFEGVYGHGCPKCGTEFDDETVTENDEGDEECPSCGYKPRHSDDSEWYGDESIGEEYNNSDPNYGIEYSETLSCFYVTKSPFYTFARYCSPCAPGAGDIDSPVRGGVKSYCFGADFFDEDSPCPYPIYSVETNELVYGKWDDDETDID
jgi:DNA-directed RNA polymerase subunit RPC12/RpoP